MANIMNTVRDQLGDEQIAAISKKIGADEQGTKRAIGAAIPTLLAGLSRNANQSEEGARSLATALEKDHDGSVLDNLGGLLGAAGSLFGGGGGGGGVLGDVVESAFGGGETSDAEARAETSTGAGATPSSKTLDGDGILGHILGGQRGTVEKGVGKASGLDTSQIARLLPMLAPIVMGALGKLKQEENLGPDELATRLQKEEQVAEEESGLGGILGGLFDSNDDGSVMDELSRVGSSGVLGSLFGR